MISLYETHLLFTQTFPLANTVIASKNSVGNEPTQTSLAKDRALETEGVTCNPDIDSPSHKDQCANMHTGNCLHNDNGPPTWPSFQWREGGRKRQKKT